MSQKSLANLTMFHGMMLFSSLVLGFLLAPLLVAQQQSARNSGSLQQVSESKPTKSGTKKVEVANFGAGCFWCVEAVFQQLKGVQSVESGYMGGQVKNPTYEQVCDGSTGHAEICQVRFDPEVITFKELLEVFWKTHDPTTLNRQGADSGTQYRSAVFYTTQEQRETAEKYKTRLNESKAFSDPIVTEISAASEFYSAGSYHADYYQKNPYAGYCRAVIQPKLDKFKAAFAEKLKSAAAK